jgi:hypothetical protein
MRGTGYNFFFLGELRVFGARNSGLRPQSATPFPTTLDPRLLGVPFSTHSMYGNMIVGPTGPM